MHILVGHGDRIGCVVFSPDGSQIASASEDQTVKLWDVRSGECLKTLQHQQRVWSVAFSPDGNSIASGCLDNTIYIWDVQNSECLRTLVGHTGWVLSVIFSHDGHQLISGSSDQTVKIWDVNSGQCLYNLQQHTNWVWSVALSPNNHIIASASEDETIRLSHPKLHLGFTIHSTWLPNIKKCNNSETAYREKRRKESVELDFDHLIRNGSAKINKIFDDVVYPHFVQQTPENELLKSLTEVDKR